MAYNSTNMSLRVWDSVSDYFNHTELKSNWDKLDAHDHTSGKGLLIPTAGITDSAITTNKIAASAVTDAKISSFSITDAKLASSANNVWRPVFRTSGVIAPGSTTTNYIANNAGAYIGNLTGSAPGFPTFHSDLFSLNSVPGLTTYLRIVSIVRTSSVSLGSSTLLPKLYVMSWGGANPVTPSVQGSVAASFSGVSAVTPGTMTSTVLTSPQFTYSGGAGELVPGIELAGATLPANSWVMATQYLQVKHTT